MQRDRKNEPWRTRVASRRRLLGGAIAGSAGLAALSLVGCGDDDDDGQDGATNTPGGGGSATSTPTATAAASEPKQGGTWLNTGTGPIGIQDPNFGPANFWSVSFMGDPLLEIDAVSREVSEHIIESWEQPDDLTVVLNVRPNVPFFDMDPANGRAVEAKDIVYTIRSMTGDQYPDAAIPFPRKSLFAGMREAVATDDSTVQLSFDSPRSDIILNLAERRTAVIPEGLREHFGGVDSLHGMVKERLIGTGPFLPDSINPERELRWVRNPNYWKSPYPYLDGYTETVVQDNTAWASAMIAGENFLMNPVQQQTVDLVQRGLSDVQVVKYEPEGFWYHIGLNTRVTPLNDPRVRKALAIAFDKPAFSKTIFGDDFRYPGPLPFVYGEAIAQDELAGTLGMRSPTDEDIAEARSLVEAASIEPFTLSITAAVEQLSTHQYQRVSEHLKSQVEANLPDISVEIDATNYTGMLGKIGQGGTGYHAYTGGWVHELSPIAMMAISYHSKGGRNFTGYSNSEMDSLLDGAYAEFDEEARADMLRQAQEIALEDWSHIPTHHGLFTALIDPRVRGLQLGSSASASTYIRYAWLEEA